MQTGDKATVKGTIASMKIQWRRGGQASLDVSLRNCVLVKSEKRTTELPIPIKSTPPLTDMLKWTGTNDKTFQARLLGLHDEKAYFLMESGRMVVMPMKNMSSDDRTTIRKAVDKKMKNKK